MSEQNPTHKSGAQTEMPTRPDEGRVLLPKCPSCKGEIKGLNVSTITLPTPAMPQGDMTFFVTCCPHCDAMVPAQFVGYTPHEAGVATPPRTLWKPS